MMTLLTYVFCIFTAFALLFAFGGLYLSIGNAMEPAADHYITQLYSKIWTGLEEDRVYAWQRVLAHLESFDPDPRLIAEAHRRKQQAARLLSETMLVDPRGRLITKHTDHSIHRDSDTSTNNN